MVPSPELHPWLRNVLALLEDRLTDPVSQRHLGRMEPDERLLLAWREAKDPYITLPSVGARVTSLAAAGAR